MQFSDDLARLRGRVINSRPDVTPDFVTFALNDRMRKLLDTRTLWADLLTPGAISFPNSTTTGTVTVTTNSAVVNGLLTSWPVNDVVNTTIPAGVPEFGYTEVTPASMAGITANSWLLVDAGGTPGGMPEVVPVIELRRTTFVALFQQMHNANCTLTQSSLAGQQLRMGSSYPIFTVSAVLSVDGFGNNTAQLSVPWAGATLTAATYSIQLMYVSLASNFKAIVAMKDEQTGYPVRLHVPLTEADHFDPQRSIVTGNPWFSLVDRGSNEQGNMTFEMWPGPTVLRQFSYYYQKQWPDMLKDTDRPPPFINPSLLYFGALADAKMMKTDRNDPYYDPEGARHYEAKFADGLMDAVNADEAKLFNALKNPWWKGLFPGNYDTLQLNDPAIFGFFGGASW
jgi:hypothetical protein